MDLGEGLRADYAVAPAQLTTAAALTAIGIAELAIALAISDGRRAGFALVLSYLFMALFWGLFMWLAFRTRLTRQREDLPVVVQPGDRGGRRAVRLGLASAVVVAAAVNAVAGALILTGIAGRDQLGMILGLIPGGALWIALQARDLRRWEGRNRSALYTRARRRRFAWTGRQAHEQLVLVEK